MRKTSVTTISTEDTFDQARRLAAQLKPGDVVALCGGVGAGKTVFVKGLAAALGIMDPIASATFTIVEEYPGTLPLIHADLYRLNSVVEAVDVGLEELMSTTAGIVVVEWADKAPELFPTGTVWVSIAIQSDGSRRITQFRTCNGETQ